MDGIVRRFWWESDPSKRNFLALKSWDKLCKPKKEGRLGFRRFKDINTAILAKLAWKIAGREVSLWTNILRRNYLKGKSFFEHVKSKGASFGWQWTALVSFLGNEHVLELAMT